MLGRSLIVAAAILAAIAAPAGAAKRFVVETNPFTFGQAPDWMPDGEHVVSHTYGPDNTVQLHVSKLDGSELRCITCGQPGPNMVAAVRPQGDWILFHSSRGKNLTVGAPGFGGLGSNMWVVRPDGTDAHAIRPTEEGHDDFHAYWSPDGSKIVWTALNWNFVTETGDGKSDVRIADFDPATATLVPGSEQVIRPANGHWYETQRWAPDGSGFLYTESYDSAINNELFFADLTGAKPTFKRLTDNPAWDEQAVFTPDMKRVIFMSTRDHEDAFQRWTTVASTLGIPADLDYLLVLPVFEAAFLQPVGEQANDLYELTLSTGKVRRLTHSGDDGWVIPEFVWDPDGERLLWTEVKWRDELRVDGEPDPATEAQELANLINDPPRVEPTDTAKGGQNSNLERRSRIGRYVAKRKKNGGVSATARRSSS